MKLTTNKEESMTIKEMLWAALWRGIRIAAAQIPALIAYLNGLGNPLWVLLGVSINTLAKFLRDKYGWDWLPV